MLTIPYGSVVVSCQAPPGSPLEGPGFMAAFARSAQLGGAGGFRVEGTPDVAAVRATTDLPIIGITKHRSPDGSIYITPSFADAAAVVSAGATLVALDATGRPRPGGESLPGLVRRIHDELGVPVLGDIDSLAAGVGALEAGVDAVVSTLSGYTGGPVPRDPDLDLVGELVALDACPVIAEGRIRTPEHVERAFALGAHAVVIGGAITDPIQLTRRFVAGAAQARAVGGVAGRTSA